jgi:hypothetical protein
VKVNDIQEQLEADKKQRWHNHKVAMKAALTLEGGRKQLKRGFRHEAVRRHTKQLLPADVGEGYDHLPTLTGWIPTEQGFVMASLDYAQLYRVAKRYAIKAKVQEQDDLLHDIIEGLAIVAKRKIATGQDFTEPAMLRTAEHIKDHYWYRHYAYNNGLDCRHCTKEQRAKCHKAWAWTTWAYCDCHRAVQLESLNSPVTDEQGNITELGNLLIDDNAIDLEAWQDAKLWLIHSPLRLIAIAMKRSNGQALSQAERVYLWKLRKREQKALF